MGNVQEIGTLFTVSKFVQSELELRLRFRHQLKEEDYKLRPDWKQHLTSQHKNYGWEHFEQFQPLPPQGRLPCTAWTWQDEACDKASSPADAENDSIWRSPASSPAKSPPAQPLPAL